MHLVAAADKNQALLGSFTSKNPLLLVPLQSGFHTGFFVRAGGNILVIY